MKEKLPVSKIILIDDDEATNYYNQSLLKDCGFDVKKIVEMSCQDALVFFQKLNIAEVNAQNHMTMVLLDLNMPGMDGWQFLEAFQKLDEQIRDEVIMAILTTSHNPQDREKAKQYSAINGYFTKPLTEQDISSLFNDLLAY